MVVQPGEEEKNIFLANQQQGIQMLMLLVRQEPSCCKALPYNIASSRLAAPSSPKIDLIELFLYFILFLFKAHLYRVLKP